MKHLGTASPQCVPGSESCPGKLQALVGEHRFTLVRAWSHEGNPVTPIDAPLAFLVAEILLNVFWPSNQSFSTVTGHLCSSMFLVLLGKNQEIFYLKVLWGCACCQGLMQHVSFLGAGAFIHQPKSYRVSS